MSSLIADKPPRTAVQNVPPITRYWQEPVVYLPEPITTGAVVNDRYEIRQKIGRGGMGVVFEAWDRKRGCRVAIKVIICRAPDGTEHRRFVREMHTQAGIEHHPNVVPVLDWGECAATGAPFCVMPLIQGETLATRLMRYASFGRLMEVRLAVTIARDMAIGLGHIHAAGVIHRDIKPSNVIIGAWRSNQKCLWVQLLDFGIARPVTSVENLTVRGSPLGTPAYMSLEQAQAVEDLDARSDLYSLGVVLYEMLLGRNPFRGATAMATLLSVATATVPRVGGVPRELAGLIEELMAKDRTRRPACAEEVAVRLEEIIEHLPVD